MRCVNELSRPVVQEEMELAAVAAERPLPSGHDGRLPVSLEVSDLEIGRAVPLVPGKIEFRASEITGAPVADDPMEAVGDRKSRRGGGILNHRLNEDLEPE